MGFAEIHFHLLPGVDDGPDSMEASVELARMAAREGTQTIVTTPHVNSSVQLDVSTLPERTRELSSELTRARVPVEVRCGGELAPEMVASLTGRQLESIAHGPAGRRWLLLEAPLTGLDQGFTTTAEELRGRGFAAVVAHPERSLAELEAGWPVLERELRAGSAIQLTAWSIAGVNGERAQEIALHLLRAWPLVAVASDAHGAWRPPALRRALDMLNAIGERTPERFVAAAPHSLLKRGLAPTRSRPIAA